MTNIHPLISKLLNDWRISEGHPRQAKSGTLVEKTTQGVPLASKDKDVSNVADAVKADRGSETEGADRCRLLN